MPAGMSPCEGAVDTALMLRVRWGDEYAFAELYRRYYRQVMSFFHGMSGDAQLSEDLCQETFLRIWKLRQRYTASGSFPAYVFAFARNVWLEQCRETRKRLHVELSPDVAEVIELAPASRATHPDVAAERSELAQYIFEALGELPVEQRMAFVMRTIGGLSISDIASAMQCPPNTVRSRKVLAINKLRESLKGLLVL